ncbi:MAG: 2-succinyl-6-hydroxy-2,4-cyclohexadiene-1-carboxylate synthase [Aggregatilineales bacterium]
MPDTLYWATDEASYYLWRAGAGTPLLLLHGFTGSAANWARLFPLFSRQHAVYAPDLPGHGATRAPSDHFSMQAAAAALKALIDQVVGEPAHVLGYSMGGRLALFLGLHYPAHVRSLTLESASPGIADDADRAARRKQDETLAVQLEREGLDRFVSWWTDLPLFATQNTAQKAALIELRRRGSVQGWAASLRGMGTGAQPSLWDSLPEINLPTHLIVGEHDRKFRSIAEAMSAQLSNAALSVVMGAGHAVHVEQPDHYARLVLAWLDTIDQR